MVTKEIPQSQDAPPEVGQSSEEEVTPKTYSEAEYLKAVSDEKTISGRLKTDLGEAVKERNDFKSQVEQSKAQIEEATITLKETEDRISNLETDIETATEGNADLIDIQKIKKELRDERKKARQEVRTEKEANAELKKTLEGEREQWAGTVAEAQAANFEVDVFEIAEQYVDAAGKDVKSERLKSLCEKAGQKKREDIQALADVLWTKKGGKKEPVLVGDSGVTTGVGTDTSNLSPREKIDAGIAKLKKK